MLTSGPRFHLDRGDVFESGLRHKMPVEVSGFWQSPRGHWASADNFEVLAQVRNTHDPVEVVVRYDCTNRRGQPAFRFHRLFLGVGDEPLAIDQQPGLGMALRYSWSDLTDAQVRLLAPAVESVIDVATRHFGLSRLGLSVPESLGPEL